MKPLTIHERRSAEVDGWILDRLSAGPVPSRVLVLDARKAGISRQRLMRARSRLYDFILVTYVHESGNQRRWFWSLRDQPAKPAEVHK